MLSTTLLALAGAALSVSALPSGGGGYGGGGYGGHDDYGLGDSLISASNFKEKEAKESISLKEICYRNLYADVEDFDLRTEKEVAVKDVKGTDVFLFASTKKDVDDKEFYFEEFCYKQTRIKEHNSKVSADSVLVGLKERSLDGGSGGYGGFDGGIGGGGFDGGISDGIGGIGIGSYGGFDGLGSLDCDSFLGGGWGNGGGFDGGIGGGYGGFDGGRGGYGGFDGGRGGYGSSIGGGIY